MFRDLGAGVGLRPDYYSLFKKTTPKSVSWVEVVSENFIDWENGTRPHRALKNLEEARGHLPLVLHGVSLSIGSADRLDRAYLKRLKDLFHRIEPEWVSDHLCWTGVDGQMLHDLNPLPYTEKVLKHVVDKVGRVQDFLGRRILLENVSSYLQFQEQDMEEWEFLSEVAQRSDCGILLDINNIYVSSVNHQFDPMTYLRAIPWESVGQIHLAGHSDMQGHLIDTHDQPVCEEVWNLYQWAVENRPWVSTMIERDDHMPEWEELEKEIRRISKIRSDSMKISNDWSYGDTSGVTARI